MSEAATRPEELVADPFFGRLKAHIIEATGLHYYATQDLELSRHLSQRIADLKLPNCGGYWSLLHDRRGETELDLLIAQLTIGETFFFRHEEQFQAIRDLALPEAIERNRSTRRLRIWSAGCATGAEPYSLAILLKQHWPDILAEWDITILGTDINRTFLDQARQGRFGEWALRATPSEVSNSCFSRSANDWVIRPEFRQCVSFQYHNLVQNSSPWLPSDLAPFDIILCRNVMIYFHPDITRRIIGRFHQCLADPGWLVVGHAESNTELFDDFEAVNTQDVVLYRKSPPAPPAMKCAAKPAGQRLPPLSILRKDLPVEAYRDDSIEAADPCYEQLARRPLNPEGYLRYAIVLQRRGRLSEAEQSLRRAIYLDRGFVLAHYYLGLLLKRRGELSAAQRCFRNTLRLLESLEPQSLLPDAEGMDACALTELTRMHFAETEVL